MTTIKATIKGGRLEVDAPADWPDGTEVEIHPLEHSGTIGSEIMSPEEINKTLAAIDLMEPFDVSADEQASWDADRKARKEREKAEFAEHAEKLRRAWE